MSSNDSIQESESSGVQAIRQLRRFRDAHHLDPNLPTSDLREIDDILTGGNAEKGARVEQSLIEDNSPYPEVRAAVRN